MVLATSLDAMSPNNQGFNHAFDDIASTMNGGYCSPKMPFDTRGEGSYALDDDVASTVHRSLTHGVAARTVEQACIARDRPCRNFYVQRRHAGCRAQRHCCGASTCGAGTAARKCLHRQRQHPPAVTNNRRYRPRHRCCRHRRRHCHPRQRRCRRRRRRCRRRRSID